MKSEPDVYSIDQLIKDKTTWWTGVRNYQARNFMMKEMQLGDIVLFYHSNAEPPGIAGLAKVTTLAQPDPSQFDKKSESFDPKATAQKPNWFCVEVGFERKFKNLISLDELRKNSKLQNLLVLKKGQRLSIQPVEKTDYLEILKMEKK
ncbi:MAG: EVE domain-containing protein [Proteobacteria bacterium]|nr:EVE domain-containing protein [Pseudomonadota bacterium]